MNSIRLQLLLAKAGVASRRHAEELIVARRVAVNGHIVSELGTKVDPVADRVTVDGKPVEREAPAYYLLNKPKGYVTTASDPEGRQTVFELLPASNVRLFSVGRLDYNTEGALLLTNDGDLAHGLMHPSRGVPKVYDAKLRGLITADQLRRLRAGVPLPPPRPLDREGRPLPVQHKPGLVEHSSPAQVDVVSSTGKHTWLRFVLHEGKNRQIHRMCEAIGSSLLKLIRVSYAGLELGELATGEYRPLRPREIHSLRQSVGLPPLAEEEAEARAAQRPERGERPERPGRAPGRPAREAPRSQPQSDAPPRRGPAAGTQRTSAPRRGEDGPRGEAPRRRDATWGDEPRRPPRREEGAGSRWESERGEPPRRGAGRDEGPARSPSASRERTPPRRPPREDSAGSRWSSDRGEPPRRGAGRDEGPARAPSASRERTPPGRPPLRRDRERTPRPPAGDRPYR